LPRRRRRARFTADGVIIGSNDLGPLTGGGTRAVALANTDAFLRQARLVVPQRASGNKALHHIVKVEGDILQAAANLDTRYAFRTEFPAGGFGFTVRTACRVIANPAGVAVVRVTLTGFDTHSNQSATQARLLGELAQGIVALQAALTELDRWTTRWSSPTPNSAVARARTCRKAPTTAPPACISLPVAASPEASTAKTRRSTN
jgi:uncharacterized protein (DUF1501 family)